MTRKPDDWMPLNIRKYLADTMHFDTELHGAYLLLLMAYWMRGGALPGNDNELAAIARMSRAAWRRARPALEPYFDTTGGKWVQKRAEEELSKARKLTNAKSEAGKKGAERKWQNVGAGDGKLHGKTMAEPMADDEQKSCQTDAPLPEPIPERKDSQSEFDGFFAVFPKQEQVENARKAYQLALDGGAKAQEILDGAKRYAAHVARDKIPLKFVQLAKNWLGDGCWKDRYGEPSAEIVLPPLHPSWPADVVKRWEKSLGQVKFRTYFGPAEYIDADPPRLRYSSKHLRRLAEEHCPQVCREVALEMAA